MWHNDYVGIPWEEDGRDGGGCDCWGLVRRVYRDQLSIYLPRLENAKYRKDGDKRKLLKCVQEYTSQLSKDEFISLTFDQKFDTFDVVWLRNGGPIHFGVMIDSRRFLHVEDGCDSVIESLDAPRWSRKVRGVFRHKSRA